MVARTLTVCLGEEASVIGRLFFNRQGRRENACFQYSARWLERTQSFALDPGLPLMAGRQYPARAQGASIFFAALADTEPDGWARRVIVRDHIKSLQGAPVQSRGAQREDLSALDFLLAVDDHARVGALRLRDEKGNFQRTPPEKGRGVPPAVDLASLLSASQALEREDETASDLAFLRGHATSLGGMRPKCTVVDEAGALCLGKFPSVTDERAVTQAEVLTLRLARKAGIDAAEARLVRCVDTPVALIKRFDRNPHGQRLPYISAASLIGAQADGQGEHAYTEVAQALRNHGARPEKDLRELWRRMDPGASV